MRTFLALFLILISGFSQATAVSGTIAKPTVWTQALSPFVVTGNINVTSTLTIESNVQVRFSANTGLTVGAGGQLLANGQPNARVVFPRFVMLWVATRLRDRAKAPDTGESVGHALLAD